MTLSRRFFLVKRLPDPLKFCPILAFTAFIIRLYHLNYQGACLYLSPPPY
jgi:hypothetical protein